MCSVVVVIVAENGSVDFSAVREELVLVEPDVDSVCNCPVVEIVQLECFLNVAISEKEAGGGFGSNLSRLSGWRNRRKHL